MNKWTDWKFSEKDGEIYSSTFYISKKFRLLIVLFFVVEIVDFHCYQCLGASFGIGGG